jgi:ribose transport system ATP-binding protein
MEAKAITKEFSGVRVLNNVNVSLAPGEILGVIGENGAGKSTFMKILSGIYWPTSGGILLDGVPADLRTPSAAKKLGISMVPQEFNLIDTLTVFENVFLGQEEKRGMLLDRSLMRSRTGKILEQLETSIRTDAEIRSLSVAQKQMVEIAKALVHDSRIIIMDEPTTVLNPAEVKILFRIMMTLKKQGVSILFISHKLGEVKEVCDRVLVLRDGEQVALSDLKGVDPEEMARRMVGRDLSQVFPEKKESSAETVLEVEGLQDQPLLRNISFSLKAGEVLGFAGLVGAGRTEVAEAIMGLRHRTGGTIRVNGKPADIRHPRHAVNLGIGYISEDRQGSGIVMNFGIPENITLISLEKYVSGLINRKQEKKVSDAYISRFNVKAASMKSALRYLSGGNQQKVYLAKWMDTRPSIIILDEPTRGIDVNAKMEIYRFIRQLADDGIACMVISSELEEIIGLCTRVLVMREGAITGELTGDAISEEEIMYYATGIKEGRQV